MWVCSRVLTGLGREFKRVERALCLENQVSRRNKLMPCMITETGGIQEGRDARLSRFTQKRWRIEKKI